MLHLIPSPASKGFTLIELTLSLLIIITLFGWLVIPQKTSIDTQKTSQTQAQLKELRQQLISFFALHKRLPCPASAQSKGLELVSASSCQIQHGFYPATSLSSLGDRNQDLLLMDAWQNPIRYSISLIDSNHNGIADWANSTEVRLISTTSLLVGDLEICQNTSCLDWLSKEAIAVIHSQGPTFKASFVDSFNVSGSQLTGISQTYPITNRNQFIFSPKATDSNSYNE